jgi:fucose 4-O-acetylase-like acetyltransferase
MQIAFAIIAVFWWIAMWGLSDIMVEDWARESKIKLYTATLICVGIIVWLYPDIVKRF